jgi:hypothetical protein
MLLLWVVVLGLPLGLALRARNRRVQVGTPPYREALRRQGPAPLRVDVGRAMVQGQQA